MEADRSLLKSASNLRRFIVTASRSAERGKIPQRPTALRRAYGTTGQPQAPTKQPAGWARSLPGQKSIITLVRGTGTDTGEVTLCVH